VIYIYCSSRLLVSTSTHVLPILCAIPYLLLSMFTNIQSMFGGDDVNSNR
jgi:hypothetical protein